MPISGGVKVSLQRLKDLSETLRDTPHIEVGVFSQKTGRRKGGLTNADLACMHEMGSPEHGLPARSMLKVPISDHIEGIMSGAKGKAEELVKADGPMRLWKLIGAAGEAVVVQAFATGGFGKWAPIKYATLLRKLKGSLKKRKDKLAQIYAGEVGQGILIDTGQLRRAFSSRVRMRLR